MRRKLFVAALAASIMVVAGAEALAQAQRQRPRPTPYRPPVSPYINLLRNDQNPSLLYQGIIRPQVEQNRFQQQQRIEIDRLNRQMEMDRQRTQDNFMSQQAQFEQLRGQLAPQRPETGHPTYFMRRSQYFPGLR